MLSVVRLSMQTAVSECAGTMGEQNVAQEVGCLSEGWVTLRSFCCRGLSSDGIGNSRTPPPQQPIQAVHREQPHDQIVFANVLSCVVPWMAGKFALPAGQQNVSAELTASFQAFSKAFCFCSVGSRFFRIDRMTAGSKVDMLQSQVANVSHKFYFRIIIIFPRKLG
jgi:hypothetical protein